MLSKKKTKKQSCLHIKESQSFGLAVAVASRLVYDSNLFGFDVGAKWCYCAGQDSLNKNQCVNEGMATIFCI